MPQQIEEQVVGSTALNRVLIELKNVIVGVKEENNPMSLFDDDSLSV